MDSKAGSLKLHTKHPVSMMKGVRGGGEDESPQLQRPSQLHSSGTAAGGADKSICRHITFNCHQTHSRGSQYGYNSMKKGKITGHKDPEFRSAVLSSKHVYYLDRQPRLDA